MGANMVLHQTLDTTYDFSVLHSDTALTQFPMDSLSALRVAVSRVRETTETRNRNARSTLLASVQAGRELTLVKQNLQHGEWTNWLESHIESMGYDLISVAPIRAAQYDMRLYDTMVAYMQQSEYDTLEEAINAIAPDNVNIAMSVFYELTRRDMPLFALDMAFERMSLRNGERFTTPQAKRLNRYAQAVEDLPDTYRDYAKQLYISGLDNPHIVPYIPRLDNDVLREMQATGALSIPGGEQVPLSDIGITDMRIFFNEKDTEEALEFIARNEGIVSEIRATKGHYEQVGVFEGSSARVVNALKNALLSKKSEKKFRVVLYIESDDGETPPV